MFPVSQYEIKDASNFLSDLFVQDLQLHFIKASLAIMNLFPAINIKYVFKVIS